MIRNYQSIPRQVVTLLPHRKLVDKRVLFVTIFLFCYLFFFLYSTMTEIHTFEYAEDITLTPLAQRQFIAANVNPTTEASEANSGSGAETWGIWRDDPGDGGISLLDFSDPTSWTFDSKDFWMEEHGLIMRPPDEILPAGIYEVTGNREVTTTLAVEADGVWKLADGASLHDVTHLPCRAARYIAIENDASPFNADLSDFPVIPGGPMPPIRGYEKTDYSVVFVLAIA